jgi:phosphate transport system substrate-binding protein
VLASSIAYKNGDAAQQLDYLPMPASVKDRVRKSWNKVVGPDGKPVYR